MKIAHELLRTKKSPTKKSLMKASLVLCLGFCFGSTSVTIPSVVATSIFEAGMASAKASSRPTVKVVNRLKVDYGPKDVM